jgi:putative endonuclease
MSWKVYVLRSQTSDIMYVGMSKNLERRLAEHNAGKSRFTSGHIPWELIYVEEADTSLQARVREKYLKSSAGKRYLEKLLG